MTIEDDVKFLERVPFLRLVGRSGLRILAIGAEQRYVHGGEILFHKNTTADSAYVVQEGSIRMGTERDEGAFSFNAGPGTLLAEMAMIAETRYSMTATALTPSTVLRVTRSLFLKMLEGYPDAARRLRDHLAEEAERSGVDLTQIYTVMRGNDRGQ